MNVTRLAVFTLAAVMSFVAVPSPARASDSDDVMSTVNAALAALNKGDLDAFAGYCDSPAAVIDDFPPHEWQGPAACADWVKAFLADNKANAITGVSLTLGTPWNVSVAGDRAYVVVPAAENYLDHGKPTAVSGNVFTFALRKTAAGWRLAAWAWALHAP